ncbi:MAG: S-layer homology domain-containing protein [Eubacteriales bacterium]|nr:S-layer homology domain-containing protein [Bacillota bacterium]MBV1727721.1 S-layer homology domain-containing protein [Desulforudis sp.]MBV1736224.1 S-layer homology domain-containing protein [Desulforudis sp.]MDZ4042037.1 S-layer homology domain-containing protein [Eubacteriales bacterium]MDZ7609163.1 S-layer homology domain-containing protein [Eubacteriales bacterium]
MHQTTAGTYRKNRLARVPIMVLVLGLMLAIVPGAALAAVSLSSITPNSATLGQTVEVTLTGTEFASGMTAKINKTTGELIVNGTELSVTGTTSAVFRFVIPSGAATGTHRLTVVKDTYEASQDFAISSIVKSIKFNNVNVLTSPQYTNSNNTLEIVVETNNSSAEVKFGSVCTIKADGTILTNQAGLGAGKSGSVYTVERYPLKPGKNSITITASVGSRNETFKFTVTYPDVPATGAEYYVGDVSGQSKIEAFGKNVVVDLEKGNYLSDADGFLATDQSMLISVSSMTPAYKPAGFTAVSPVFQITADNSLNLIGKPGKLTLKYTSLGAPDNLTVYRASTAAFNTGLKNMGGQVNQKAGTITIPLDGAFSGFYAVFISYVGAETYSDLPSHGWYYHSVSALRAKGVMEPTNSVTNPWAYGSVGDASTFGLGTGMNVRRGEFAFMMVRGLGLTFVEIPDAGGGTTIFSDVNSSVLTKYYRQSIETAARHGLIRGYPPGAGGLVNFGWDENLNRQQVAVIIARAGGLPLDQDEGRVKAALAKLYSDYDPGAVDPSISTWAAASVLACNKAKLMGGSPVTVDGKTTYEFNGKDHLTRAEAASLVHRYMLAKKLI